MDTGHELSDASPMAEHVVIMGAGPAGLTAAYELRKHGVGVTVLERDPVYVGGLARTSQHNGFRFDVGGHRFFSKSQEIEDLWTEILGDQMLTRDRLSRIYYRGRYFDYPLRAVNALVTLGPVETTRCMASYVWARLTPIKNPRSLEDWVRNQFGYRLFSIFFKTYTEKVWGISTKELSADWAAQRIKGLDMWQVVRNALKPSPSQKDRSALIKTLIDEFRYPRRGPGQMWEKVAAGLAEDGTPVRMGEEVAGIHHRSGRVISVETRAKTQYSGTHFISTLPMRDLVQMLEPTPPDTVLAAAGKLGYRDFLTVVLILDRAEVFPDNWVYVHDPSVKVGRLQNFKRWSPDMVPDQARTSIGMEYFCFEGDGLWSSSDEELVELATKELTQLGISKPGEVRDGAVVRMQKAYPVYDDEYLKHVAVIRDWLRANLPNLHLAGRNGMHKYNNQDHSMMTGLVVARNIATGSTLDPWKVNTDAQYLEEGAHEGTGRQVPARVALS